MNRKFQHLGDLFRDAAATLLDRPWRTLATATGVIIGVASGIFTMMLTSSEQGQVDRNFDRQLAPLVVIEAIPSLSATTPLSPMVASVEARINRTPATSSGGELSTWQRDATVTASRHADTVTAPIFGASPGGLIAAGVAPLLGGDPTTGLLTSSPPLAWLGQDLADQLGIDPAAPTGAIVIVNGQHLTVAGITSPGTRYPALGRGIIVSSIAATTWWGPPEQPRALAHVRRGAAPVAAEHLLVALDPGQTADLRNATPPDGQRTRKSVGDDVQRAGAILTAIALAFGVISVANVLSSSVAQRSTEIGLRSALGWTTPRIARLILTEATLLSLYAAALGAALGTSAAWVIAHHNTWTPILPTTALWIPPIAGLAAGALGGLIPAIKAGRIPPTEALRS